MGCLDDLGISIHNRAVLLDLARVLVHVLQTMPAQDEQRAGQGQTGQGFRDEQKTALVQRGWPHALEEYEKALRRLHRSEKGVRNTLGWLKDLALCVDLDASPGGIEAWLSGLAAKGVGAKSLNNRLCAVRSFYAWAVRAELVKSNPAGSVPLVRAGAGPGVRAFTPEEAALLVAVAEQDEARRVGRKHRCKRSATYVVAWNTGLRRSDLTRLRRRMVILSGDVPHLKLEWASEKNRKGSSVPLSPEAARVLTELCKDLEPNDLVFSPDRFCVPHERVVQGDMKAAGIAAKDEYGRSAGMHSFRKGLCTKLLRDGVPASTVQRMMRHADIRTTLNVYNDVRLSEISDAVSALPTVGCVLPQKKSEMDACKVGAGADTWSSDVSVSTMQSPSPKPVTNPRAVSGRTEEASQLTQEGPVRGFVTGFGTNPPPSANGSVSAIAGVGFEPTPGLSVVGLLQTATDLLNVARQIIARGGSQGAADGARK